MYLLYLSVLPLLAFALPQGPPLGNTQQQCPQSPADCCGPTNGGPPQDSTPKDTCNTPVYAPTADPAPYAIHLEDTTDFSYGAGTTTGQKHVDPNWPSTCSTPINSLCANVTNLELAQWHYAYDPSVNPTCLIGVYIPNPDSPSTQGAANRPNQHMCADLVLSPIANAIGIAVSSGSSSGGNPLPNRASVNVKRYPYKAVPGFSGDMNGNGAQAAAPATNGEAVNSGYASWMMQAGIGPGGLPGH